MKLYELFEERSPEFEKSIEPYLTGQFVAYSWRNQPVDSSGRPMRTMAGMEGKLPAAVKYHAREFNGERWPALEKAFLSREVTYRGKRSDYLKPRMGLFSYLININTPWPEGEEMADSVIDSEIFQDSIRYQDRYINSLSPVILQYLIKYQKRVPELIDAIKSISHEEYQKNLKTYHDYQDQYRKWQNDLESFANKKEAEQMASRSKGLHDEDEWGSQPLSTKWMHHQDAPKAPLVVHDPRGTRIAQAAYGGHYIADLVGGEEHQWARAERKKNEIIQNLFKQYMAAMGE